MTEHDEQTALIVWARLHQRAEPRLALLYAIPNGGVRHKATARRLAAEGVAPGVPDLCLACSGTYGHALYIEMKTASGRLSAAQRAWRDALIAHNNGYILARSWIDAARAIRDHLDCAALTQDLQ